MKNKRINKNCKKIISCGLMTALIICLFTGYALGATLAKASLSVSQSTQTAVSLKWEKITGADGYKIYRATAKTGDFKLIKTVEGRTKTSYKNTGLTLGKAYYYKVRAYKKIGGGISYGRYSTVKSQKLTYARPKYSVYIPTSLGTISGQSTRTIVITLTNNSKSDNAYFDGVFALEESASENSKIHNITSIKFEKPETGASGVLAKGSRLILRPGEKVRFTCALDSSFSYERTEARVTTCIRYKGKDFVGVYSMDKGNKVYTAAEYYEYLFD